MDEQKTKEYNAFSAYYAEVVKRPGTAATRSLLNQLRTIAVGQFGNGPFQEILRANKTQGVEQATERKLGKQAGGVTRRSSSPEVKQPIPGTGRYERLKEKGLLPGGRSEASAVVAADDANVFTEKLKRRTKEIAAVGATADDISTVQLSTGSVFNTETGATENDLFADAPNLSAKDLVEKYGRDLIFEYLFNAGEDRESMEQKTDRQLANILKKRVSE